jgi:protein-tyrosine phosphatase
MEESLNADVVVMDAEWSGASAAAGYDINQQVQALYDFGQDDSRHELKLPAMERHHRSLIYGLVAKQGLQYVSGPKDPENPDAPVPSSVLKPESHHKVTWKSPYGPDEATGRGKKAKKSYDKIPIGHSEIIAGFLYLGSGRDADAVEELNKCGINHVLNVTQEWTSSPRLAQHNIVVQRILIKDFVTESIGKHFEAAFAFMDDVRAKKGRVLIHCVIGKSRSASVVLAYLMAREKMSLREAFDHVRKTREFVRPNDAFLAELGQFEMQLFGVSAPTVGIADLPPMKDPGARFKLQHEAGEKFVRDLLTDEAMEPLARSSKNVTAFLKKLRESVVQRGAAQIKAAGLTEKKVNKLVNQTGTDYYKRREK